MYVKLVIKNGALCNGTNVCNTDMTAVMCAAICVAFKAARKEFVKIEKNKNVNMNCTLITKIDCICKKKKD